jgi:transglutaminase-like putative cysteine protease
MSVRSEAMQLELASWRPTLGAVSWLALALAVVAAPHALHLPVWLSIAFVTFIVWRWQSLRRGWWLPGVWTTALISGAMACAVTLEYRTVFGRDAGVALITVFAAMKLLELRNLRDAYVAVCLAFFLVVTNFLYSQSIGMGIYMVVSMWVTVTALVTISQAGQPLSARLRGRLGGSLIVQALPVMLVLFVVFPRIPGPLWGLPNDARSGQSGLSDNMSPGDISNLSLSNAVAFRVKFDDAPPDAKDMYWRGPVLEQTDGRNWTRSPEASSPLGVDAATRIGRFLEYEVTLEPTQKRWLFTLEMAGDLSVEAYGNSRLEVRRNKPVRERLRYRASSGLDFRFEPTSPKELESALQLRKGFHPQARRLVRRWLDEDSDPDALVKRALTYFGEQPFVYTLRPPLLEGDTVDEFLFLSRRGFCEHYASSFTVLMRAAGIPARVVTGYQGGEWNEIGEYWTVRQRDAHAWSEVWIEGKGWIRVDPTAAVSPERIEGGMDLALPTSSSDAVLGMLPGGAVSQAWRRMRLGWDSVNDSWNQWVLGYGPNRQRQFFNSLGIDSTDWRQIGLLVLGAVFLVLLATAAWIARRRKPRPRSVIAYERFCARLSRAGLERPDNEGPVDFGRRAQAQFPYLADEIARITSMYIEVRYASRPDHIDELVSAVKGFRVRTAT